MIPQSLLLSLLLTCGLALPAHAAAAPAGPAAPAAKTARRTPPTPTPTPPARPGAKKARPRVARVARTPPAARAVVGAGWKHTFTEQQRSRLRAAGCRFDGEDRAVADGLHGRGFDAEQVTRAWELAGRQGAGRQGAGRQGAGRRKHVPAAAVFVLLGIPQGRFKGYVGSGLSLSDWYNRRYLRGTKRVLAGWVLTGAGIAGVVAGVALLLFYPRSDAVAAEKGSSCGLACGAVSLGGIAGSVMSLGTAATLFAAGLPILLDGYKRKARWVKGQLLDTGSADDIRGKKRQAHLRRLHGPGRARRAGRARLRVLPHIGPTGGGLTLGVRF